MILADRTIREPSRSFREPARHDAAARTSLLIATPDEIMRDGFRATFGDWRLPTSSAPPATAARQSPAPADAVQTSRWWTSTWPSRPASRRPPRSRAASPHCRVILYLPSDDPRSYAAPGTPASRATCCRAPRRTTSAGPSRRRRRCRPRRPEFARAPPRSQHPADQPRDGGPGAGQPRPDQQHRGGAPGHLRADRQDPRQEHPRQAPGRVPHARRRHGPAHRPHRVAPGMSARLPSTPPAYRLLLACAVAAGSALVAPAGAAPRPTFPPASRWSCSWAITWRTRSPTCARASSARSAAGAR